MSYFIKWKGYSNAENTWEPEINLVDCKASLDDFEKSRADNILGNKKMFKLKYYAYFQMQQLFFIIYIIFLLGAKIENGKLSYLIQMKDSRTAEVVEASEVKKKWPSKLIGYLQKRMNWEKPPRRVTTYSVDEIPIESENPIGESIEILCR